MRPFKLTIVMLAVVILALPLWFGPATSPAAQEQQSKLPGLFTKRLRAS